MENKIENLINTMDELKEIGMMDKEAENEWTKARKKLIQKGENK